MTDYTECDAAFEARFGPPPDAGYTAWTAKLEGFRACWDLLHAPQEPDGWIDGEGDPYTQSGWGARPPKGWTATGTPYPVYQHPEQEASQRDAERYRWLRAERFDDEIPRVQSKSTGCIGCTLGGMALDTAIDQAMKGTTK